MTEAQKKIVERARRRFELAVNADTAQRKRETDVLKFDAGDQWPDDAKKFRGADIVNGVPIPARPMLTIPKTNQPVSLVINQIRGAHLGIQVHPESEDASDDTAEVLQGLIRHIEVHSRANLARLWAAERAVKAGRGCYRVLKAPAEFGWAEYGDQELVIKRVLNQASAYFDPFAEEPDWCDGRWAFLGGWMAWDRFEAEFPKSRMAKEVEASEDTAWESFSDECPSWVSDDDDGKAVRVMEYFTVTVEKFTRCAVNGQVYWQDKAPEDAEDPENVLSKADVPKEAKCWEVEKRKVHWYKLNGIEILEEQEWDGQYIPLIPVIGNELNIDGERRWQGMIEPAMDGARMFNYAASALVEKTALSTKAPYMVAEGQDEGYEDEYAQANVRNFPALHYKPTALGDKLVPPPIRNFGSVDVTPELAMLEQADAYIKSVTAVHDPSLGEDRKQRSGKAVLALQQQAQESNSNYLETLAAISMTYEAKVLLDLIPKVYDRPGRVARILGIDDEPQRVMLNAPFTMDQSGKRPQPAMEGAPDVKRFDLDQGRYGVTVSVGKSYQTRAQQGADEMGQMLQAVPNLWPVLGDVYMNFRDFPGHKEAARRLKKMLPPPLQEEQGGRPTPEMLQAELQKASQAYQQLQQQHAEAVEEVKTDRAKTEGQVAIAKLKEESAVTIERMKIDAELEIARIKAQADIAKEQIKAQMGAARAAFDAEIANEQDAAAAGREMAMGERERQHASTEAERARRHEATEGQRSREHESSMAGAAHLNSLEAQEAAAKLAPKPAGA